MLRVDAPVLRHLTFPCSYALSSRCSTARGTLNGWPGYVPGLWGASLDQDYCSCAHMNSTSEKKQGPLQALCNQFILLIQAKFLQLVCPNQELHGPQSHPQCGVGFLSTSGGGQMILQRPLPLEVSSSSLPRVLAPPLGNPKKQPLSTGSGPVTSFWNPLPRYVSLDLFPPGSQPASMDSSL